MTQVQLAGKADLSLSAYRKIETGKSAPRVASLQAIAAALEVPLQHLVEPVRDICGLLESRGIKVDKRQIASPGFFGLSVAPSDGGPAIVVNTQERIPVERWNLAASWIN